MILKISIYFLLFFRRKVNKENAEKFVKENKLDFFIETSAKTGFNARNVS